MNFLNGKNFYFIKSIIKNEIKRKYTIIYIIIIII